MTRAMNDLHRAARPTRLPTGASTQLQLPSGRNPGSPSRCQPRPPTLPPSLSHLKQSRECPIAEERRWGYFVGAENAQNEKVEQLAANRLSIPQDAIASLLQRLVRAAWVGRPRSRPSSTEASGTPQDAIASLLHCLIWARRLIRTSRSWQERPWQLRNPAILVALPDSTPWILQHRQVGRNRIPY